MLLKRQFNYGQKIQVKVVTSGVFLIACLEESTNEGFIVMAPHFDGLPKVDERGTIVFEKIKGQDKGYFRYYSDNQAKA